MSRHTQTEHYTALIMSSFWKTLRSSWKKHKEIRKSRRQIRRLVKLSRLLLKHGRFQDALKANKIAVEVFDYMRVSQFTTTAAKKNCEWEIMALIKEGQFIASEHQKNIKLLESQEEKRRTRSKKKVYFNCTPASTMKQPTQSQLMEKQVIEACFSKDTELANQANDVMEKITESNLDVQQKLALMQSVGKIYERNTILSAQNDQLQKKETTPLPTKAKNGKPSDEEKEIEEITKSLMNNLNANKSSYKFSDVIGIDDAKDALDIAIRQQNIFIKYYESKDLEKCKGIMLFG